MLHVITMHSKSKKWTSSDDLFGPTVSLCAKINSMTSINGMVTGSDLYQITRSSYSLIMIFVKNYLVMLYIILLITIDNDIYYFEFTPPTPFLVGSSILILCTHA
jgi:hypothetical protein